jgi:hypothetical protein
MLAIVTRGLPKSALSPSRTFPYSDEAVGDRNWCFAYFLGREDNGIGSEESGNPLTIGPFSAR